MVISPYCIRRSDLVIFIRCVHRCSGDLRAEDFHLDEPGYIRPLKIVRCDVFIDATMCRLDFDCEDIDGILCNFVHDVPTPLIIDLGDDDRHKFLMGCSETYRMLYERGRFELLLSDVHDDISYKQQSKL